MNSVFPVSFSLCAVLLFSLCVTVWGYEVSHPVFPASVSDSDEQRLRTETGFVMDMSEDEIAAWLPAKSPFYIIACPNCEYPGGRRDRKTYWRWSPQEPDRLECANCGMVFPNEQYPTDQVDRIEDPTGQINEYRYYEGPDGYKYYLPGRIHAFKKAYLERMAEKLADLYAGSGEEQYARQAAMILHRLAQVYPHYNAQRCRKSGSPVLYDIPSLNPPDGVQPVPGLAREMQGHRTETHYPYWSNRRGGGWNGWFYSEMPVNLAYAYDRIAASEALDSLADQTGDDVRQNIEQFLRATANFARSYPIYLGNMDPSLIRGLSVIGRVIGEPEFVHDAVRRVKLILKWQFFPDGNWKECAPSYHSQTVKGLMGCATGPLAGYSDPEGYVNPEDGLHIENLQAERDLPFLAESLQALENTRMPHGPYTCIHDTWAPRNLSAGSHPVPDEPIPTHLHWGMGHAMLGMGRGQNGVQAHLHFSGGYGHTHADTLNLILFGQGRELACDIGYTHTILRPYANSSLAHNLVLVDEQDQRTSGTNPPADGHLASWAEAGDTVRYCEASGAGAYPEKCSEYRRALAVVKLPDGGAYVVDVFRVTGGSKHDWVLHGSADEEQTLQTDLSLQEHGENLLPEGVEFHRWPSEYGRNIIDGRNNSYGLFREVQSARADDDFTADFVCEDGAGMRTSIPGMVDTTAFFGRLPSIRRANRSSARVYDFWMPAILLRREGADLQSVFAAVHEPFDGAPLISEVSRLELAEAAPGTVAIVCRSEDFVDY
ncbi:MAG: heparinase II/III family protein, partial [Armatimonadota bacterium]